MVDTSKKYKIVGQGDDVINDWHTPLADYHLLINALAYCEETGVEFPIRELISFLIQRGYGVKDSGSYSISSTEDLFEALIHPHFRISNEAWGGDSPGRSGHYKTAYLELGHTKEIRKILKEAEQFMIDWLESSDANKLYSASILNTDSFTKQATQENNGTEIRRQQWEDSLFNQVEIAVKGNQQLTRLNYFVFHFVSNLQ
jgi:DNA-dependent RNA polymerase auxiliary subunit epsilon